MSIQQIFSYMWNLSYIILENSIDEIKELKNWRKINIVQIHQYIYCKSKKNNKIVYFQFIFSL